MPAAYYNENDPFAADWLENLIAEEFIPHGYVDRRSIADVEPGDLHGFAQCHFFAGIGGWAYAARLAGWPDDLPLWTGSPPCQPFSVAGKQRGTEDHRHLWPEQFRLIRAARPARWFGEQVAGKAGLAWLDGVLADLENSDYAGRAFVIPACGVGAPHRRERLWIAAESVGDTDSNGCEARGCTEPPARHGSPAHAGGGQHRPRLHDRCERGSCCALPDDCDGGNTRCSLADAEQNGRNGDALDFRVRTGASEGRVLQSQRLRAPCGAVADTDSEQPERHGIAGSVAGSTGCAERAAREQRGGCSTGDPCTGSGAGDVGDVWRPGLEGFPRDGDRAAGRDTPARHSAPAGFWGGADWLMCADGKRRRVKPGLSLLVNGLPRDVAGSLAGYGNAIVPHVAAEVLAAYLETRFAH